ncbi:MAG TPA: alpha/beta fold hydrolase [Vineibacter sp.]|nr:alpha/beta fold hydrolase [Vineibacter sp.]
MQRTIKRQAMRLVSAILMVHPAIDAAAAEPVHPGQLITAVTRTANPLPDAAENFTISYISTSFDGRNTVVYGRVALPKTPAPQNGYPVISWANGTTGFAPQCAPSLMSTYPDAYLNEWVKRGYAVLRTDYEGWGASGPRPVIHGRSNAAAVADIVTAAHHLTDKLSNDWIAVGHSEGGGAVLWAAALNKRPADKYPLKAAIAIAPIGPGILKFMDDAAGGAFVHQAAQPFISVTVLGAQVVDPSINLNDLVADPMMAQVAEARTKCLADLVKLPQLPKGQYLKAGDAYAKLARFVREQDASSLTLGVPALIIQAQDDKTTVTPDTTGQMIKSLCSRGASVTYKQYEGQGHSSVIGASREDALGFAEAAFAGRLPAGRCHQD